MGSPKQPITLKAEQVEALSQKLSLMRHDINNMLSLMNAAVELIRTKPDMRERMIDTVLEQSPRITNAIDQFSSEFRRTLNTVDP